MGMKVLKKLGVSFLSVAAFVPQLSIVDPSKWDYRYTQLVTPEDKLREQKWSLVLGCQELVDMPFYDAVHNYITLTDPMGIERSFVQGGNTNRETGQTELFGGPENAIYATTLNTNNFSHISALFSGDIRELTRPSSPLIDFKRVYIQADIVCADFQTIARKYLIALDACDAINRQDLPYYLMSQNSNSVVYTLVKAMDLEFPEVCERAVWAPGHGHDLLPEGWTSVYETWVFPSDDPEFINWYIEKIEDKLALRTGEVMWGGPAQAQNFEPLVIENALETFTQERGNSLPAVLPLAAP